MSNDYTMKLAVDGRSAEQGVKQFTSALSDALKTLRDFDRKNRSAFDGLRKIAKTDLSQVAKSMRGTAQAIETLNKVKISRQLVNNLQMLQQTLARFRFNATAIKAVPDALNALARVRVDSRIVSTLREMREAMLGWKSPPAGAVRNLANLTTALNAANPSRIEATARALSRLNGLTIRASHASLPNFAAAGSGLASLRAGLNSTTSAANMLRTALAGVSATVVARGIYQTGNSFVALQRTLGAVASSTGEVQAQMDFLSDLTTRMPVSLEAAASSYGKFAVAARLSGVSVADTQRVFEGFSTAFAAMGVDAEKQRFGFLALEQIFSKGRVTAEELRQQLGEHLPGAMQLLADSIGVPTAKLISMMEAGEIGSDSLIKMASTLQQQFGPALASAMNSSSAQIVNMQNAWTDLKRIIFDSGFNAGLGAMAKQIAEVLRSDDARRFAADIGSALGQVARAVGATVKVMADNRETVVAFFKVLGGYAAIAGTVSVLRLLASPLAILAPLAGVAASAFGTMKSAIMAIATGKALAALGDIGKAFTGLGGKIMVATGAVLLFAAGMDALFNDGRATKAIVDGVGNMFKAFSDKLTGFGADLAGGVSKAYESAWKESEKYFKDIQSADLLNADLIARNSEREAAHASAKLSSLSEQEAELWKQVNPVAAANVEFQKQLGLLDAIAAKKGINVNPIKAALAAQTLDDRNPAGALARDLREDLATLRAKTGEQRALNAAQDDYNALLRKGQDIGTAGLDALKQYYTAVARLNGEIGNGIERWVAKSGDWADQIHDAIATGIEGLSDELTNFITGAETDFVGLTRSILRSFVKISLDSLLKDMFSAMGFNPEKSATASAEAALAKLAGIGENITTAMTNVYTSGLSINGMPVGAAGSMASSPELPANRERLRRLDEMLTPTPAITRAPLAPIAGTNVASPFALGTNRFPLEGAVPGLRGSYGASGAFSAQAANMNLRGSLPLSFGGNAGRMVMLSPAEIIDLKKTVATEWVRSAGDMQGKGIIDTILNRKASGRWGDSITDVVNARSQFSDINGRPAWQHGRNSVDDLPLSRIDSRTDALVDNWLAKRMGGAPSSVGDHLNYANPYWSDKVNQGWISRLQGPTFGVGKAIHQHGTTADLERFRPGAFGVSATGIDPSVTGSIDALNAKLQTVSATAAQTAPAFDTLRAANSNLASASTMAGSNVQMAGTMASAASPQFQHAGSSIMTAGQQAQMAGTQAQSAQAGLSGFGGGISQLLGPLASAVPGLGQFGSMIVQLVQQLAMGGGGGLMGGLFSEGGYSDSPVTRARVSAGLFANAPHFAEGTANTSGGMPAILHENEAVIPLTRGRKVPVEMPEERSREAMYGGGVVGLRPNITMNVHGVKDFDTFRRNKRQVESQLFSAMRRGAIREGLVG